MNYKHFITLAILISMALPKVMAEKYLPYLEGKKAIIQYSGYEWGPTFDYFYGDTLVDSKIYKKAYRPFFNLDLWSHLPNSCENPSRYIQFLDSLVRYDKFWANNGPTVGYREDSLTRKVYIKYFTADSSNTIERVFLDFAPTLSSGVKSYGELAQSVWKIQVGMVSIGGVSRRAWKANQCEYIQGWIEGIGYLESGNCMTRKVSQGVDIIYDDYHCEHFSIGNLNDLSFINVRTDDMDGIVDFILNNSQLTYTLCGEHASVPAQCKVYGANGSVVFNGQIGSTPQTVSTASLSPGIYLAVVTTSAGEVLGRHKFVVK